MKYPVPEMPLLDSAETEPDRPSEREELEAVLAAAFRPKSNMARILRYVSEKHLAGAAGEIKEYSIAIEALHRPSSFDPARDSIVRVEAHRLRNRLAHFYANEGAAHAIRIVIPPGSYIPQFLPQERRDPELRPTELQQWHPMEVLPSAAEQSIELSAALVVPPRLENARGRGRMVSFAVLAAFFFLGAVIVWLRVQSDRAGLSDRPSAASTTVHSGAIPANGLRILTGMNAPSFVDSLGRVWSGDRYFVGGSAEDISPKPIAFAEDSALFVHRRRGRFSYAIPLRSGVYELRLYFADAFFGENNPDGGGESSRIFDVDLNGKPLLRDFDVISDAGGSNTEDVKVFGNVEPDKNGMLRLDFLPKRDVAFLNGIEIIPSAKDQIVPIRIVMAKNGYEDTDGHSWEADHFYRGGVSFAPTAQAALRDRAPVSERFGNFVYAIPVPQQGTYKATLSFKEIDPEHVLQESDGHKLDVFRVLMNGVSLVDRIDIPSTDPGAPPLQKTFTGLHANAQGKLIFSFVPIQNYALLNSIKIENE